jgi:hypothetical protein
LNSDLGCQNKPGHLSKRQKVTEQISGHHIRFAHDVKLTMPDIDVKNDTGFPDFLISLTLFPKEENTPLHPSQEGNNANNDKKAMIK